MEFFIVQCIAETKLKRRCQNLAQSGKRFCGVHKDRTDWTKLASTAGAAVLGNFIFPGVGGAIVGAVAGNIFDSIKKENRIMTKRVFVSFDYDKDRFLKDSVLGQSKHSDSPFEITNWSLNEAQPQAEWKKKARERIKRSDIVLVMVGTHTHKAPGVLAEVSMARDEKIKVVQVRGYEDKTCLSVPDAGQYYKWTWNNLKSLLS